MDEGNAPPLTDQLEAMIGGERLEQPECVERAGDRGRQILDASSQERMLQHGEVEACVVCDEDGAGRELEQPGSDLGEARRRGHVPVADSVNRCGFCRDRT